jgi:hypothetical protein
VAVAAGGTLIAAPAVVAVLLGTRGQTARAAAYELDRTDSCS